MSRKVRNENAVITSKQKIIFLVIKRVFDIFIGLIGSILLIPVSIVIKIALICTRDKGPLFFKQRRVGQYGKEIYIYKKGDT